MKIHNPIMILFPFWQGKMPHSSDIFGTKYAYFNSRLAEIVEVETENYLKMDPDPFDERHPSRTDPSGTLGQVLKALFKKENFTNKVMQLRLITWVVSCY